MARPPTERELAPAASFLSHAKNRSQPKKQFHKLARMAEGLRECGIRLSRGDVQGAHTKLDDIARGLSGHTHYADIHLADVYGGHEIAREFESTSVHTISDLANSNALKLAAKHDLSEVLTVALLSLRRILDLEQQRVTGQ